MSTRATALELVRGLPAVGLDALVEAAELHTRIDTKYVVDWRAFAELVGELGSDHRALEIGGVRAFQYDTVYFDSPDLLSFRAHAQGRRRRFKVRVRHYEDTGTCVLEVKLKGRRGQTVKHRIPYSWADRGALNPAGRAFVEGCLEEAYEHPLHAEFRPVLRTRYHRVTLAAAGTEERLTCDFDLRYPDARDADGSSAGLSPEHVIVEAKSPDGRGHADRALRALGARPLSCSKYVVGIGLSGRERTPADLRRLSRLYFVHPARSVS